MYFNNFKNRKTFESAVEDLQHRLEKKGMTAKLTTRHDKIMMYHEMMEYHDTSMMWALYLKEVWNERPKEIDKYIEEYPVYMGNELYSRNYSTVEVARFYALAIHMGKLPSLPDRKRKATLKCLADSLTVNATKLHREFVKAEDLIGEGKFRVFKNAQRLMGYIP